MKSFSPLLLAGSLLLNATLVALLLTARRQPAAAAARHDIAPAPQARVELAVSPGTWAKLQTDDLPTLVARLRDAGFPPKIVRAILQAQFEDEYFARRRAANPAAEQTAYWKSPDLDPKAELELREFAREQMRRLRELLGPDADSIDPLTQIRQNRQLSHLAPEKAAQVRQLLREFNELRNDVIIRSPTTAAIGTTEREKLAAIERRQTEEIARLLTPREFEEYELRGGTVSNYLRSRLGGFDATEDEFRAMFRILQPLAGVLDPAAGVPNPDESRRRSEALREASEQLKAVLGPVRGAAYERAANHEYARTSQLVARLQLPPERTAQIWETQQAMMDQYRRLSMDSSLSPDERRKRVDSLRDQAANRLTPLLGGARGYEAYRQNVGGWLQAFATPSAAAPRP